MKPFFLIVGLLGLFLSPMVSRSGFAEEIPSGIAAVVNEDLILFSQLATVTATQEQFLAQRLNGDALAEAVLVNRISQLNRMVDRLLLLQELKRWGQPLPSHLTEERIDVLLQIQFSNYREQWLERLRATAKIKIY